MEAKNTFKKVLERGDELDGDGIFLGISIVYLES